jgi:hypothetical protein
MTQGSGGKMMRGRRVLFLVTLGLSCLLFGCGSETPTDVPLDPTLEPGPLLLARPFFTAGYELAGYYELDADRGDGIVEALVVLTLRSPATNAFEGSSAVLLFAERDGAWLRTDELKLTGVNASAESRDLTGDGFPELLVTFEAADIQYGDFVTPLRYTGHLHVFAYTPDPYLVRLGEFSSSLAGDTLDVPVVGEWGGQPAIQTRRDVPPTGFPLWQPVRVETFAWDGREFASVQVEERQRISPIVSWVVRHNAPWTAAFLVLGGILSLVVIVFARRRRLRERWLILGLILLLVAGGIGLGLAVEWVCAPALIVVGLVGLQIGRRVATRLTDK